MNIINFLARLWNSVRSLFNSFPASLKSAVHLGVRVTENIKNFVDSPLADVLTAIIPGETDDKIKLALRNGLPVILSNLKLAEDCGISTDPQEVTHCALKALQNLSGDIKNAYLHTISVLLAQIAADGKLTWSDGVCIVEWYYQQQFKSHQLPAQ